MKSSKLKNRTKTIIHTLNHFRQSNNNVFFKTNNPAFLAKPEAEAEAEAKAETETPKAELDYFTSIEKQNNSRKMTIQNKDVDAIKSTVQNMSIEDLVELCILSPSAFDFTLLLCKYVGDCIRCIDKTEQIWERKSADGKWEIDPTCISDIRRIISDELPSFFSAKQQSIRALLANKAVADNYSNHYTLKYQNITYILARLASISMKNQIVKEATDIFFV